MIQMNGSANWNTEWWKSLRLNRKKENELIFKNKDTLRDLSKKKKTEREKHLVISLICGI